MKNVRVDLSAAREDLYEPLMRAVCPSAQGEAAVRLVHQVEPLWNWLLAEGFVEHVRRERYDILTLGLAEALAHLGERAENAQSVDGGPELDPSSTAVLIVAASLAGSDRSSLRNVLHQLTGEHLRLVLEAMMYAAGYMDGSADPWGHEGPGVAPGEGPNSTAREERLAEL
ncbi:hypothetical protein [Kitasatospora sp. NPDC088134]|uniref:hypothetical protein n=1 Tax=Kitasatospora sp. NPDC088134 TaxID=3364071 RepID=UPI003818042A